MKRIFAGFVALLVFVAAFCMNMPAYADFNGEEVAKSLQSPNYYMINTDTDTVVFNKGENDHIQPGAMIKVLAALYAIEKWGALDESITIEDADMENVPSYYGIRKVGFSAGDSYTKLQLIQAMFMYSANDAEAVIATRISGSIEEFCKILNSYAKELGCNDTNVVSIYGFDEDGQFSSAKDVATIFEKGMKNSTFADTVALTSLTLPKTAHTRERNYTTATQMVYSSSSYYHASVKGGKETETKLSGKCTAVVSTQDGYSYVTVVMGGKEAENGSNTANSDAKAMVAWVYKNLSIRTLAEAGAPIATLPVKGGKKTDTVQLTVKETISSLVSNNVSSNSVLITLEDGAEDLKLTAPIQEGQEICSANIYYAGESIATVKLVAAQTVSRSAGRLIMQALGAFMSNGFVIFIEVVAVIALIALLVHYVLKLTGNEEKFNLTVIKKAGKDIPSFGKKAGNFFKNGAEKVKGGAAKAKNSANGLKSVGEKLKEKANIKKDN